MAKVTNSKPGFGELSTIIGADANFEGKLTVKQSMRVDGKVKGELISSETITVGSTGSLDGELIAKDAIIGGKIIGSISATGKTILEHSSILNGDLKTSQLVVQEGAKFNGNCDMGEKLPSATQQQPRKIKLYGEDKEDIA
ncbi:polymer-forming cytoskeletal protein [bacterium]|nr:polymer-forming cytoskeletal protein [bacterium]